MSLPHLLLGLLTDEPLSGYDLHKAFQTTVAQFWTADQSQIYRALYKMEADGWLRSEVIPQVGNPNKKIYHLTHDGHAQLQTWLITPIEDDPPREAWLGQIFFGDQLEPAQMFALLDAYAVHLRTQLEALSGLYTILSQHIPPEQMHSALFFRLSTLDYGIAKHRFELHWVEDFVTRLRQRP